MKFQINIRKTELTRHRMLTEMSMDEYLDYLNRKRPPALLVLEAALFLNARWRVSRRGVPHVVGTTPNGTPYSVTYFSRGQRWRVFWPYKPHHQQERETFNRINDVKYFIKGI